MISILMPVYNAEYFLKECLDSTINQSFKNWELIAIDDHSTDLSRQILEEYSKIDIRISVLKNIGKGIIPALRLAYSVSKGELVTRMDADDIMPEIKLECLFESIQKKGVGYIVTGQVKYFSSQELGNGYTKYQNWLNELCKNQNHFKHIYKECVIPSACWIAYRSDLEIVNAFHESGYPEDYDLAFRFYKQGLNVLGVNKILHLWRDHDARTSRNDPNYADQNFFSLKLKYFLEIDYNGSSQLFLWGAGRKGKSLAKLLIDNRINFSWLTNNEKKIGKDIYGVKIKHPDIIENLAAKQVIVTISDRKFVAEKSQLYKKLELNEEDIFEF